MKAKGTPAPNYELTVAAVADTTPREYVFVVGNVAFKSLDSLKKFVAGLPPGAALRWAPGCCRTGDEPLLSSPKDMEDFKTFCKEKKVQFVLVPSG